MPDNGWYQYSIPPCLDADICRYYHYSQIPWNPLKSPSLLMCFDPRDNICWQECTICWVYNIVHWRSYSTIIINDSSILVHSTTALSFPLKMCHQHLLYYIISLSINFLGNDPLVINLNQTYTIKKSRLYLYHCMSCYMYVIIHSLSRFILSLFFLQLFHLSARNITEVTCSVQDEVCCCASASGGACFGWSPWVLGMFGYPKMDGL